MGLDFSNSNITIDLTEECNLACTYCFTWAEKHKKRVLPRELGYKIIDHWLANGHSIDGRPRELSFWGGEPLLEWELLQDLVRYTLKEKGEQKIVFGATTNGLLYTPDKVEWCKRHNSLMLVSLDGPEHIHDRHRKMKNSGKGSWKIVDRNVREALKIAPESMVRTSLSKYAAPHFLEIVKYYVEDLGVQNFIFSPVFEDPWDQESYDILEDQFSQAIDYIVARMKNGENIAMKHFDDESQIPENTDLRNPVPSCGAGNNYSCWSVDGVNFPCHRFNKHEQTTFQRIMSVAALGRINSTGEYVNLNDGFRDTFLTFKDNPSESCQSCDIFRKSTCNGGCYALNWDMTQDIHGIVKSQCEYNKIQRRTGLLYAKKLKEAGIKVNAQGVKSKNSCTCYNMCYMENTPFEVIHVDRQSDMSCACYNTNFSQITSKDQYRPISDKIEEKQKILDAVQKMLPKNKVVSRAFNILKGVV